MRQQFEQLESKRTVLQGDLDRQKSADDRNRLGQFATPPALASAIVRHGLGLLPSASPIRFLDPAIGSGAFYSALRGAAPNGRVRSAVGYEIDPHYGIPAQRLWAGTGLDLTLGDFTRTDPSEQFNLLICNPPYVRHHHLEGAEKIRLQQRTEAASGIRLSGLGGLYCHFLGLCHSWMAPDGVAGWLIPSEFMDVNYGAAVKNYLLTRVNLLQIHRFDPNDVQFSDALVSSAVVWFRNSPPEPGHKVAFTFGGTLDRPLARLDVSTDELAKERKWTRFPGAGVREQGNVPTVSDFFSVKRGLATGDNGYFILSDEEIHKRGLPMEAFLPILPSSRYIDGDVVEADKRGLPKIARRMFLLDPRMDESEVARRLPSLVPYLEEGKARGLHERYLCSHRKIWFAQENRPPAPIVCTYLGRSDSKKVGARPFRFVLNKSRATVANTWLAMYPKPNLAAALELDPSLIERIWEHLNAISPEALLGEGRVYGGGLHKMEPKELGKVPVPFLADVIGT